MLRALGISRPVMVLLVIMGLLAPRPEVQARPVGVPADGLPESVAPPYHVWLPVINSTNLAGPASAFTFGVYPGGGTGETPNAPTPSASAVSQQLQALAGNAPFAVHLYTAWSWYDPTALDAQVGEFASSGFRVVLTVKYSPPPGHEGDVAGFSSFVAGVVDRYAGNAAVTDYVVGNEANVSGNPSSSDGAFAQAHLAVSQGVVAARQELVKAGSAARVGINFAVTDQAADAAFLQDVARLGGDAFAGAVQFVGIDIYPGLWPAGTGQPYTDLANGLQSARASVDAVASLRGRPIQILEIGAPDPSEADQDSRLGQFVQATLDLRERLNVTSFFWFDLWDSDSQATSLFGHYGLLRSDLTQKASFVTFRQAIAGTGANPSTARSRTVPAKD